MGLTVTGEAGRWEAQFSPSRQTIGMLLSGTTGTPQSYSIIYNSNPAAVSFRIGEIIKIVGYSGSGTDFNGKLDVYTGSYYVSNVLLPPNDYSGANNTPAYRIQCSMTPTPTPPPTPTPIAPINCGIDWLSSTLPKRGNAISLTTSTRGGPAFYQLQYDTESNNNSGYVGDTLIIVIGVIAPP